MDHIKAITSIGVVTFLLFACGPTTVTSPDAEAATQAATIAPTDVPESDSFTLAAPGPFFAGNKTHTIVDESRNGRKIQLTLWYPALKQTDADGHVIIRDAAPDMSAAPYPMILTGGDTGGVLLKSHLASHGFVTVIIRYPENLDEWDLQMIGHPRDILFTLDQIASDPPDGLDGVIDTDRAGVTGYSSDGDAALAVSGARIDPAYFLAQCEQAPTMEPSPPELWLGWVCHLAEMWDRFSIYAGDEMTSGADGLWQPVTDERIRAVMPMSSAGAWLYGERGLAAVDRPILIIAATEDDIIPYELENVFIFEHLQVPERFMVSFVGQGHMMVFNPGQVRRMNHFATAFFGTYLQGRDDYTAYFSEDFVSPKGDLAWGVYDGE